MFDDDDAGSITVEQLKQELSRGWPSLRLGSRHRFTGSVMSVATHYCQDCGMDAREYMALIQAGHSPYAIQCLPRERVVAERRRRHEMYLAAAGTTELR